MGKQEIDMTKTELITALNKIARELRDDPEAASLQATRALLDYIDDPDVTAAYLATPRGWM